MILNKYDSAFFERLLQTDYAFAVWRRPNSSNVEAVFCRQDDIVECQQIDERTDGFVFAPFEASAKCPIYVFPDRQVVPAGQSQASANDGEALKERCATHQTYLQKLEALLLQISADVPKVVLSRCQWHSQRNQAVVPSLFSKLCELQPEAFVYMVSIPKMGCWAGASPELLFSAQGGKCATVALAGTQPADCVRWTDKEKDEQQWVARHISDILNDENIIFTKSDTYTSKTGTLAHLRTDFSFNIVNNGQIGRLVSRLHPTPAICGLPVAKARHLLKQIEGYDRQYYSGFVGPISGNDAMLYVNIRCLQAFSNGLMLYAGAGITASSVPESEWNETELKLTNLSRIFDKL